MSESCSHNCESCGQNCSERTAPESMLAPANPNSNIRKVIAVVSGKGGVGKSLVTSMLAALMQRRGHAAAILDADVTGPSIPKMFSIHGRAQGSELGILPRESKFGTKVMSVNLLLEHETDPVVWRGTSLPEPSPSSGRTCSGGMWTLCSWICLPEPATCP